MQGTRCTEMALLLQLYSAPLATMFARHDALVVPSFCCEPRFVLFVLTRSLIKQARSDRRLPMEAVDFCTSLTIQDAQSLKYEVLL